MSQLQQPSAADAAHAATSSPLNRLKSALVEHVPRGWAVFGVIACLLLIISFQWHENYSTDLGWQLRTGEWIAQHHAVPYTDQLAYTTQPPYTEKPRPWIEARWLFCLVQYLTWQIGGIVAITLAATVIIVAMYAVLLWPSRRVLTSPAGLFIIGLTIWVAAPRFLPRPEIVSFLMIAAYIVILERRSRWIWVLPVLQIVWTNAHALFIFGPALAWLFAISNSFDQRQTQRLGQAGRQTWQPWFVSVVTTLVCLINPYGLDAIRFPFLLYTEIGSDHLFARTIAEFKSPLRSPLSEWAWDLATVIPLLLIAIVTCVWNRRRVPVARVVVCAVTLFLAVLAVRNETLFAIAALWTCARNIEEALRATGGDSHNVNARPPPTKPTAQPTAVTTPRAGRRVALPLIATYCVAGLCVIGASWWVMTGRYAAARGLGARFGFGLAPWYHGQDAINFVLAAGPKGNIYNHISEGGWLAWRAKGRYPVFVDGRLEVYGDQGVMRDYLELTRSRWQSVFARYHVNTAIVDAQRNIWLGAEILHSPDWALVHLDPMKAVFLRNIPEHAALIAQYRIDLSKPFEPRGPEPDERVSGLYAAIGGIRPPYYSLGLAVEFLSFDSISNAEKYIERAYEAAPNWFEARAFLATLRRFQGRTQEADDLLRGVWVPDATRVHADSILAGLLVAANRRAEAIPVLREALRLAPNDEAINLVLAECCLMTKDYPAAAEAYRVVLRKRPRETVIWANLGQVCEAQKDWPGAIQAYQSALNVLRNEAGQVDYQARLLNQIGVIYGDIGDLPNARQHFQAALKLNPNYASPRENLKRMDGK